MRQYPKITAFYISSMFYYNFFTAYNGGKRELLNYRFETFADLSCETKMEEEHRLQNEFRIAWYGAYKEVRKHFVESLIWPLISPIYLAPCLVIYFNPRQKTSTSTSTSQSTTATTPTSTSTSATSES